MSTNPMPGNGSPPGIAPRWDPKQMGAKPGFWQHEQSPFQNASCSFVVGPEQTDMGSMKGYTEHHTEHQYLPFGLIDGFYESVGPFYGPPLSPPSTVSAATSLSSLSTSSLPIQAYSSRNVSPLQSPPGSVASGEALTVTNGESLTTASILSASSASTVGPDYMDQLMCLGPQCNAAFPNSGELEVHIKEMHTHTCNWAGCTSGALLSTREELVAHVKSEHLLLCPVESCLEAFASRKLVAAHLAVCHPERQQTAVVAGKRKADGADVAEEGGRMKLRSVDGSAEIGRRVESRKLSEHLNVTFCKRRCAEKLRAVLEKRARRAAGGTPRAADFRAGETKSLIDSATFPLIWEHSVLPFLIEFIPKWCGPGHVITVTRRSASSSLRASQSTTPSRRINVMTRKPVSRVRRIIILRHVLDLIPESYRQSCSMSFSEGEVSRLVWARGFSRDVPDEVCPPRNPFHFKHPCMGDSIGIGDSEETEESTATLGPSLIVRGGPFWLANLHPFIDAVQAGEEAKMVQHPSPADRFQCAEKDHDALEGRLCDDFALGRLTAWSGFDLRTTRLSHDPYWEEMDKEPPMVVTDWSLISSSDGSANICRRFPQEHNPLMKEPLVRSIGAVSPGSLVTVSSRTSGYQRAVVGEVPAYLDGASNSNGTGIATREWFVEDFSPDEDDNEWIRGGVGVPGDSGAAIVDADGKTLVGQLWGRNSYWGRGQRITFFTPISDVLDDVQERCRLSTRPTLPQYRDESDRYPMYPSCRQCYDLMTYLESRRSSRESLLSMIGMPPRRGAGSEHEPSSTNVPSELDTPKDQGHWFRLHGLEEAGSSFAGLNNHASPIPLSSFFPGGGRPTTPTIAEGVKSPYAQMLKDVDLYDGLDPVTPLGKRPGNLVRSEGKSEKRQRVS